MEMKKGWVVMVMVAVMMMSSVEGDPTCSPAERFSCGTGRCCSKYNWCGSSAAYCARQNCIAHCWPGVTPLIYTPSLVTIINLTANHPRGGSVDPRCPPAKLKRHTLSEP